MEVDYYFKNAKTNDYLCIGPQKEHGYDLILSKTLPAHLYDANWFVDVNKTDPQILKNGNFTYLQKQPDVPYTEQNGIYYYPVWAAKYGITDITEYYLMKVGSLYSFTTVDGLALGVYTGGAKPNFPCVIGNYNSDSAYKWILEPVSK